MRELLNITPMPQLQNHPKVRKELLAALPLRVANLDDLDSLASLRHLSIQQYCVASAGLAGWASRTTVGTKMGTALQQSAAPHQTLEAAARSQSSGH